MPEVPEEVAALLDDLAVLDMRATVLIARPTTLQGQFNHVDPWATALQEAAARAATTRVRIVGAIYKAEELSLAKLAKRIGKSKSRADDLVRAARRQRTEDGGST